jgi:Zn ribbon nucleic-acid-binding protein
MALLAVAEKDQYIDDAHCPDCKKLKLKMMGMKQDTIELECQSCFHTVWIKERTQTAIDYVSKTKHEDAQLKEKAS